jgi:hypothetical protein
MASMQEIDALYDRVYHTEVMGSRFGELTVMSCRWHTRWADHPTEGIWAVVHMVAHGAPLDAIIASIERGEAPDGMVPCEDADRALAEIRRNR